MFDQFNKLNSISYFPFLAPEIFLPLRGRCLGRPQGLRRRVHVSLVRVLALGAADGAVSPLHQLAPGPIPLGENGGISGAGAFHLHVRGRLHHDAAPQRERGNRHNGHGSASTQVCVLQVLTTYE